MGPEKLTRLGNSNVLSLFTFFLNLQYVSYRNRKKKFPEKVLNFGTKKMSCMKINTLFSGTFFWFQYDFIQKSPFLVENAWEHRMFTTMEKNGLDFKNTPG